MKLEQLLNASGSLVEDVLAYGKQENLSRYEVWLLASLAHVMLRDLLYPDDVINSLNGINEASATYRSVLGQVDSAC